MGKRACDDLWGCEGDWRRSLREGFKMTAQTLAWGAVIFAGIGVAVAVIGAYVLWCLWAMEAGRPWHIAGAALVGLAALTAREVVSLYKTGDWH